MSGGLEFVGGGLRTDSGDAAPWPRLALFGDPVEHSLSPRMHDAALAAAKLEGKYRAIRVPATELAAAAIAAFDAGVLGLNLTIPHKVGILRSAEEASEEVTRIGAANTLLRLKNGWAAHNTDSRGFALALQSIVGRDLGRTVEHVVILGAGGAARAVAAAICSISSNPKIRFFARKPESILWASEFGATVEPLEKGELGDATLVVQATPLGMAAGDPSPVAGVSFPRGCICMDLAYPTKPSQFLRDASAAGCVAEAGARMLVAQGALAFTMWFGGESPLEVMAAAIELDW